MLNLLNSYNITHYFKQFDYFNFKEVFPQVVVNKGVPQCDQCFISIDRKYLVLFGKDPITYDNFNSEQNELCVYDLNNDLKQVASLELEKNLNCITASDRYICGGYGYSHNMKLITFQLTNSN